MFGLKKLFGGNKEADKSASNNKDQNGGFFMELQESAEEQLDQAVDKISTTVDDVAAKVGQQKTEKTASQQPKNQQQKSDQDQEKEVLAEKQQESAKVTSKDREPSKSPTKSAKVLQEKIPTSVEQKDTNGKGEKEPEETTFAPKYLMPTTTQPRRRPGPSLAQFKDMAREVNTNS